MRLVPYIEELLEDMGRVLQQRAVVVTVVGDRQLADAIYPAAFARMTRALIQNALDHAWPSETAAQLRIGVSSDGGTCILTCEDNGIGIEDGSHDRVFEPFFSNRRMTGAAGLGLHAAHNIVHDLLGGSIRAEPVSPHGCRMTAEWPVNRIVTP